MSKDILEVISQLKDIWNFKPATAEEIMAAEKELGLKFADDYIKCVSKYGVLSANGIELTGITEYEDFSVVAVTQQERELDWNNIIPPNMYVIENLGIDGLIALQDETGTVYSIMPYDDEPEKWFDCLADYIIKMTESDEDE